MWILLHFCTFVIVGPPYRVQGVSVQRPAKLPMCDHYNRSLKSFGCSVLNPTSGPFSRNFTTSLPSVPSYGFFVEDRTPYSQKEKNHALGLLR